jgi:hypothetical protein
MERARFAAAAGLAHHAAKACAITDHASMANTDSEEGMKAKPFDLQEIECDRVERNAQPAASLAARIST